MNRKTERQLLKTLVTLSIPTVIEQILETIVQYVDTAMVGRLGEQATAAVSVTTTVSWLLGSVISAFAIGILAMVSRAAGERNQGQIGKLTVLAVWFVVIIGLLEGIVACTLSPYIPKWMGAEESIWKTASTYFAIISFPMIFRAATGIFGAAIRAVQDTRTPMLINLCVNVMNVILNYIFIYQVGLGVVGAAIASAISYTFGGIIMFLAFRRKTAFTWKGERRLPEKQTAIKTLKISIPAAMTSTASCLGYVVFAGIVSGMGTTVFAAHSIAVTAETIFYIPGYGMSTAVSTLIGHSLGEGNRPKFEIVWRQAVVLTIGMMCLNGIFLYLISDLLMGVFTPSEQVIELGGQMLRIVAFSEPFFGLMIIMQGIYNGLGRTGYSFKVETASMWGIRILFSMICVRILHMGLQTVWYCMVFDNVTKALLYSVRFVLPKQRDKLWGAK